MNRKLLLIRTNHDIGNSYLYAYSQEIMEEARMRGWKVERAENEEAQSQIVFSRLNNRPHLVMINGHGTQNEVCGHKDAVLLGMGDSHRLANAVTFIRACASRAGL